MARLLAGERPFLIVAATDFERMQMTKRIGRIAALLACGGVMLQLAGCAGAIGAIVAQQVITGLVSTVLIQVLGQALGAA
jgi:hypothetical protein